MGERDGKIEREIGREMEKETERERGRVGREKYMVVKKCADNVK